MEKNIKANILSEMMDEQRRLVLEYERIESLPSAPIDIQSKGGQKILKDFGYRFIEEIGEAFDDLATSLGHVSNNQPKEAMEFTKSYNLEVSDAWHFLLELLIYAGYTTWSDVDRLLSNYVRENEQWHGLYVDDNPFGSMFRIASAVNFKEGQRGTSTLKAGQYQVVNTSFALAKREFQGGRNIGYDDLDLHAQLLWKVTASMTTALNTLKNRAWTQEDRSVSVIDFERGIILTMLHWAIYLEYAGFTEISIGTCFRMTTDKNWKRIKDGY